MSGGARRRSPSTPSPSRGNSSGESSGGTPSPGQGRGSTPPRHPSLPPNPRRHLPNTTSPVRANSSGNSSGSTPSPVHGRGSTTSRASSAQDKDGLEKEHAPPPLRHKLHICFESKRIPSPDDEYSDILMYGRNSQSPIPSKQPSPVFTADSDNFPSLEELRTGKRSISGSPSPPPLTGPADSSQHQTPTSPADQELAFKGTFKHLLNNSGKIAEGRSYYQVMASGNFELQNPVLEVKFDHLLTPQYMALAIRIMKTATNDREHSWLQPVAREFLNAEFKLQGKSQRTLRFRFVGQPISIQPLSAFRTEDVVWKQDIYEGRYGVVRTSETGRLVYLSVVTHALAVQQVGKSWKGQFLEKDIFLIRYPGKSMLRCLILADVATVYGSEAPKIADMKNINAILTPRYAIDGVFPPFFDDLQDDLTGLTPRIMRETGILTVLPFHYAVMPPAAWGYLIWNLHKVIQQLRSSGTDFSSVFGQDFVLDKPDWRPQLQFSDDDVMKGVYNHENFLKGKDKFTKDLQGGVDCNRHLLQHGHHHPKGRPVRVRGEDENELFGAIKMPHVIPGVIRGLFKKREMEFKKELGEVYAYYCRLCYDVAGYEVEWTNV